MGFWNWIHWTVKFVSLEEAHKALELACEQERKERKEKDHKDYYGRGMRKEVIRLDNLVRWIPICQVHNVPLKILAGHPIGSLLLINDRFVVSPHGKWKKLGKQVWYRWTTAEKFFDKYILNPGPAPWQNKGD